MTDKLVSILIPCYNHEPFLDDCLGSILAQDYGNIELLICDDCSPDNSYAKILSYEQQLKKRFSRVEILRNETNCGVTRNVNRMLAMAKGDYVKTIASDDAMTPDAISGMVAYLNRHPEVSVVVANGVRVLETERYPHFTPQGRLYDSPPDFSPEGFFLRVARCNPISAPAAMVRMEVYRKFGMYDETVKIEDLEFWLRCLKDGVCRFGFLDADLLFYRINANSMSSAAGNTGLARRRKVFHESEISTFRKYRACFAPAAFSEIVLLRILQERYIAIENRLWDWDAELVKNWKTFDGWQDLSARQRLSFYLINLKQRIKKCLYRH